MKKLIIAGGTGFLGEVLIDFFKENFEEIIILSRSVKLSRANVSYVNWDGENLSGWEKELDGADVLINLAGKSVDCRYNEQNKKMILDSRIKSTKALNLAVSKCTIPPKHFIQSSTATIYEHSENFLNTEAKGIIGDDFSMNVAKEWEREFLSTEKPNTKITILRTSIVLGKNGGALVPLKNIVKLGLGGKQGSGKQRVSWIHEYDFANAIKFCIKNSIEGTVNLVAPNTVSNKEFMFSIRKKMNVPIGLPAPKIMLKIGTFFLQTESELVLKSRNVYPERLLMLGFNFKYPTLNKALFELI